MPRRSPDRRTTVARLALIRSGLLRDRLHRHRSLGVSAHSASAACRTRARRRSCSGLRKTGSRCPASSCRSAGAAVHADRIFFHAGFLAGGRGNLEVTKAATATGRSAIAFIGDPSLRPLAPHPVIVVKLWGGHRDCTRYRREWLKRGCLTAWRTRISVGTSRKKQSPSRALPNDRGFDQKPAGSGSRSSWFGYSDPDPR